jgi:hypothetical protein
LDAPRGEFATILQVPRTVLEDVVIEPYDSWSGGAPRITPDERVRVSLLEQAQFAFSLVRDATALLGLGADDDARAALVFASALAGELPANEAGYLTRIDSAVAAPRLDLSGLVGTRSSARPLLCELARAVQGV